MLAFCDASSDGLYPFIPLGRHSAYAECGFRLAPIVLESRKWSAAVSTTAGNEPATEGITRKESEPPQIHGTAPQHYGLTLDTELASEDPFYAISGLFELAVAAETQFVNMVGTIISEDVESVGHGQNSQDLKDFQYHGDVLNRHSLRLEETIRTISDRHLMP